MIQIAIIALYLAWIICFGIKARKASNEAEFEGNNLGILMCVAIGAGEWLGGTSISGVSEYGFIYGISGALYTIANAIGICFLALFLAKFYRKQNVSTVPGIIGNYLGKNSRIVASAILWMIMVLVGVSQMIALGAIGESLLHIDRKLSIILFGSFVIIYTFIGGMNVIGNTNIVHMLLMYAGLLAVLFFEIRDIGGISVISSNVGKEYFNISAMEYEKVLSWVTASVLGACTAQAGIQPILRSKNEHVAVKSSFLIALCVAPFGVIIALLGIIARFRFPTQSDGKIALYTLILSLNPVLSGIVMASLLAAVLSTAAPILISCGTLLKRDIYDSICAQNGKSLQIARFFTVVSGAICIFLGILLGANTIILDFVYFAYSLRGSLFIIILFAILSNNITEKSAIISMILTGIVSCIWLCYKQMTGDYLIPHVTETYVAIIIAIVGCGIGCLINRRANRATYDCKA